MLKLYKRIKRIPYFHEAWICGAKIHERWGRVGEPGQTAEHARDKSLSREQDLERILAQPIADGFEPIDDEDLAILTVEYVIDGMGTEADLNKRHQLETRLEKLLAVTGVVSGNRHRGPRVVRDVL